MKWPHVLALGSLALFWIFCLAICVTSVFYDPGTGEMLPAKPRWKTLLLVVLQWLPFVPPQ